MSRTTSVSVSSHSDKEFSFYRTNSLPTYGDPTYAPHTHSDKVIAVFAPPFYVVGSDNKHTQAVTTAITY